MKKSIIKRQTNTTQKLEDSLLALLEEFELGEIKTRELCSIAKVNHQTFYNYYYDHYDLYEDIEAKAINEGLEIIKLAFLSNDNQSNYIEKIKDTKYLIRLFKQKNNYRFKERIKEIIQPELEKKIKVMSREKEKRYLTLYILNGSLSILDEWIKNNTADDYEYIASLLYKIAGSIDIYH